MKNLHQLRRVRRLSRSYGIIGLIVLATILTYFAILASSTTNKSSAQESPAENTHTKPAVSSSISSPGPTHSAKLLIAGDTMLAAQVGEYIEDGLNPFQHVKKYFREFDLIVLNLETAIAPTEYLVPARKRFLFNAPLRAADFLVKAGVDAVSLANNHTLDYGSKALTFQLDYLKQKKIPTFGAGNTVDEAFAPTYLDHDGVKIALLAFNDAETSVTNVKVGKPGAAYFDFNRVTSAIKTARKKADVVIVYPHWGQELSTHNNSRQAQWARTFIDAGADLVVGAHTHVIQNSEQYKGKWIYYSLGNFIFSGTSGLNSVGLILEIEIKDKKLTSIKPRKVTIDYHGFPRLQE